jgi:hypothetical protein
MDEGLRASDADRERATAQLQSHFAAGRLTRGELDVRLTVALQAAALGDLRLALADLPGAAPAPKRVGSLERSFRRLLAFYPPQYRRVHAEEMLAVLMTAATEGKRRPGLAEAADLIAGALRVWCQTLRGGVAGWRGVLALASAGAVLGLLAGMAFAGVNRPLPTSDTTVMTGTYTPGAPDGRSWYRINLPPNSIPAAERKKLIEQRTNELQHHEALTEAALADSRRVMAAAAHAVRPAMSVQALQSQVKITNLTGGLMWITAQGMTAVQAERAASAVAHSYIAYVNGKNAPGGRILRRPLACQPNPCRMRAVAGPPVIVPGPSLLANVLDTGGLGALYGALIGATGAVALSRPGRRFRMT